MQNATTRHPTWNPVLFQPRGGPLMLFYKVGPSPREWWGMVITSTDDTLIPRDVSAPMADEIPGALLAVIDGAGHLSNLERSDEFTRLLDDHLTRCGS